MTIILAIQLCLLFFLSFTPIWIGGQAMSCFNDGNLFKSALCVLLGTVTNFAIILTVSYAFRFKV